jgi:hypothetical protein
VRADAVLLGVGLAMPLAALPAHCVHVRCRACTHGPRLFVEAGERAWRNPSERQRM